MINRDEAQQIEIEKKRFLDSGGSIDVQKPQRVRRRNVANVHGGTVAIGTRKDVVDIDSKREQENLKSLEVKKPKITEEKIEGHKPETQPKQEAKSNMIEGKLEVTIKLNEMPEVEEKKEQKTFFKVLASGLVFSASMKNKTFNKNAKKAEEFDDFMIALNGKLGAKTENGFELESLGMQVFEKKPKVEKVEEN